MALEYATPPSQVASQSGALSYADQKQQSGNLEYAQEQEPGTYINKLEKPKTQIAPTTQGIPKSVIAENNRKLWGVLARRPKDTTDYAQHMQDLENWIQENEAVISLPGNVEIVQRILRAEERNLAEKAAIETGAVKQELREAQALGPVESTTTGDLTTFYIKPEVSPTLGEYKSKEITLSAKGDVVSELTRTPIEGGKLSPDQLVNELFQVKVKEYSGGKPIGLAEGVSSIKTQIPQYQSYINDPNWIKEYDSSGNLSRLYTKPREYTISYDVGKTGKASEQKGEYIKTELKFNSEGKLISEIQRDVLELKSGDRPSGGYYSVYKPVDVRATTYDPLGLKKVDVFREMDYVTTYNNGVRQTIGKEKLQEEQYYSGGQPTFNIFNEFKTGATVVRDAFAGTKEIFYPKSSGGQVTPKNWNYKIDPETGKSTLISITTGTQKTPTGENIITVSGPTTNKNLLNYANQNLSKYYANSIVNDIIKAGGSAQDAWKVADLIGYEYNKQAVGVAFEAYKSPDKTKKYESEYQRAVEALPTFGGKAMNDVLAKLDKNMPLSEKEISLLDKRNKFIDHITELQLKISASREPSIILENQGKATFAKLIASAEAKKIGGAYVDLTAAEFLAIQKKDETDEKAVASGAAQDLLYQFKKGTLSQKPIDLFDMGQLGYDVNNPSAFLSIQTDKGLIGGKATKVRETVTVTRPDGTTYKTNRWTGEIDYSGGILLTPQEFQSRQKDYLTSSSGIDLFISKSGTPKPKIDAVQTPKSFSDYISSEYGGDYGLAYLNMGAGGFISGAIQDKEIRTKIKQKIQEIPTTMGDLKLSTISSDFFDILPSVKATGPFAPQLGAPGIGSPYPNLVKQESFGQTISNLGKDIINAPIILPGLNEPTSMRSIFSGFTGAAMATGKWAAKEARKQIIPEVSKQLNQAKIVLGTAMMPAIKYVDEKNRQSKPTKELQNYWNANYKDILSKSKINISFSSDNFKGMDKIGLLGKSGSPSSQIYINALATEKMPFFTGGIPTEQVIIHEFGHAKGETSLWDLMKNKSYETKIIKQIPGTDYDRIYKLYTKYRKRPDFMDHSYGYNVDYKKNVSYIYENIELKRKYWAGAALIPWPRKFFDLPPSLPSTIYLKEAVAYQHELFYENPIKYAKKYPEEAKLIAESLYIKPDSKMYQDIFNPEKIGIIDKFQTGLYKPITENISDFGGFISTQTQKAAKVVSKQIKQSSDFLGGTLSMIPKTTKRISEPILDIIGQPATTKTRQMVGAKINAEIKRSSDFLGGTLSMIPKTTKQISEPILDVIRQPAVTGTRKMIGTEINTQIKQSKDFLGGTLSMIPKTTKQISEPILTLIEKPIVVSSVKRAKKEAYELFNNALINEVRYNKELSTEITPNIKKISKKVSDIPINIPSVSDLYDLANFNKTNYDETGKKVTTKQITIGTLFKTVFPESPLEQRTTVEEILPKETNDLIHYVNFEVTSNMDAKEAIANLAAKEKIIEIKLKKENKPYSKLLWTGLKDDLRKTILAKAKNPYPYLPISLKTKQDFFNTFGYKYDVLSSRTIQKTVPTQLRTYADEWEGGTDLLAKNVYGGAKLIDTGIDTINDALLNQKIKSLMEQSAPELGLRDYFLQQKRTASFGELFYLNPTEFARKNPEQAKKIAEQIGIKKGTDLYYELFAPKTHPRLDLIKKQIERPSEISTFLRGAAEKIETQPEIAKHEMLNIGSVGWGYLTSIAAGAAVSGVVTTSDYITGKKYSYKASEDITKLIDIFGRGVGKKAIDYGGIGFGSDLSKYREKAGNIGATTSQIAGMFTPGRYESLIPIIFDPDYMMRNKKEAAINIISAGVFRGAESALRRSYWNLPVQIKLSKMAQTKPQTTKNIRFGISGAGKVFQGTVLAGYAIPEFYSAWKSTELESKSYLEKSAPGMGYFLLGYGLSGKIAPLARAESVARDIQLLYRRGPGGYGMFQKGPIKLKKVIKEAGIDIEAKVGLNEIQKWDQLNNFLDYGMKKGYIKQTEGKGLISGFKKLYNRKRTEFFESQMAVENKAVPAIAKKYNKYLYVKGSKIGSTFFDYFRNTAKSDFDLVIKPNTPKSIISKIESELKTKLSKGNNVDIIAEKNMMKIKVKNTDTDIVNLIYSGGKGKPDLVRNKGIDYLNPEVWMKDKYGSAAIARIKLTDVNRFNELMDMPRWKYNLYTRVWPEATIFKPSSITTKKPVSRFKDIEGLQTWQQGIWKKMLPRTKPTKQKDITKTLFKDIAKKEKWEDKLQKSEMDIKSYETTLLNKEYELTKKGRKAVTKNFITFGKEMKQAKLIPKIKPQYGEIWGEVETVKNNPKLSKALDILTTNPIIKFIFNPTVGGSTTPLFYESAKTRKFVKYGEPSDVDLYANFPGLFGYVQKAVFNYAGLKQGKIPKGNIFTSEFSRGGAKFHFSKGGKIETHSLTAAWRSPTTNIEQNIRGVQKPFETMFRTTPEGIRVMDLGLQQRRLIVGSFTDTRASKDLPKFIKATRGAYIEAEAQKKGFSDILNEKFKSVNIGVEKATPKGRKPTRPEISITKSPLYAETTMKPEIKKIRTQRAQFEKMIRETKSVNKFTIESNLIQMAVTEGKQTRQQRTEKIQKVEVPEIMAELKNPYKGRAKLVQEVRADLLNPIAKLSKGKSKTTFIFGVTDPLSSIIISTKKPTSQTTKKQKKAKTRITEQKYGKISQGYPKGKISDINLLSSKTNYQKTYGVIFPYSGYSKYTSTPVYEKYDYKNKYASYGYEKPYVEKRPYKPYVPKTPYIPYNEYSDYKTTYKGYPGYKPYVPYTTYTKYTPYKPYSPYTPYTPYTPYSPYRKIPKIPKDGGFKFDFEFQDKKKLLDRSHSKAKRQYETLRFDLKAYNPMEAL